MFVVGVAKGTVAVYQLDHPAEGSLILFQETALKDYAPRMQQYGSIYWHLVNTEKVIPLLLGRKLLGARLNAPTPAALAGQESIKARVNTRTSHVAPCRFKIKLVFKNKSVLGPYGWYIQWVARLGLVPYLHEGHEMMLAMRVKTVVKSNRQDVLKALSPGAIVAMANRHQEYGHTITQLMQEIGKEHGQ